MFMKRVKNPRNVLMKAEVTLGVFAPDPVFVSVWTSHFRMKRGMMRGHVDRYEIGEIGGGGTLPSSTGKILTTT